MKTGISLKSSILTGLLFCFLGMLTSCLESGDETISLMSGKAEEMILGSWKIDRAEIYDLEHTYISDLPENALVGAIYELQKGGSGKLIQAGKERNLSWSFDDDFSFLNISSTTYEMVSLGEKLLVIEVNYTIKGETVILRYLLTKHASVAAAEEEQEEENKTSQTVSSSQSGKLVKDGFVLTIPYGAVPKNDKGTDGKVAFSVQNMEELPAALPDGVTLIEGTGLKFEPMNFTFESPLTLEIPLNGYDVNEIGLYRYDEATNSWQLVPFSSIENGKATAATIDLGYFVLAKKPSSDLQRTGGLYIPNEYFEEGYYYYVTLVPKNGNVTGVKRIGFTANGQGLYMSNLPFGNYRVVISREDRGSLQEEGTNVQYTNNEISVSINTPLQPGSGNYDFYEGWESLTNEDISGGLSWVNGRPDNVWGDKTVTYGTGKFQATLTWVNVQGQITDYDLHLTLPNQSEVYFGHKKEAAFELDRDWISTIGNATENIYSISDDITSGTYKVRVHLYGGVTGKRYNCRILMDGVVVKSVSGSISTQQEYEDIYSFTIE